MAVYFGTKYIFCKCCIFKICCFKKEKLTRDLTIIKKYQDQLICDFNVRNLFDIVYVHHKDEHRKEMVTNVLEHKKL